LKLRLRFLSPTHSVSRTKQKVQSSSGTRLRHPPAVRGGVACFYLMLDAEQAFTRGSATTFHFDERAQESPPSSGAKRSRKSFAPSSQGLRTGIAVSGLVRRRRRLIIRARRRLDRRAKTRKPKRISQKSTREHRLCSAPRIMKGGDFIRPLFDRLSLWSRRGRFRSSQVVSFLKIPNGLFGIIS
jgi:hypothetical protein